MTHQSYEESTAAYLLGALPELEHQAFEQHLQRCEECQREVELFRPAAAALPRAATPVTPPARLKASLMEVIEREASAQGPAPPKARGFRARLGALMPTLPRLHPAGWVAAALLLALGAGGALTLSEALRDDNDSRTFSAKVDTTELPRATARLTVPEHGEGATLRTRGMPSLDENSVYQVWLQRDGKVVSQSLFEVQPDGHGAGAVTDSVEDADAVMVTREPAGGSPAPTEKPVIAVEL